MKHCNTQLRLWNKEPISFMLLQKRLLDFKSSLRLSNQQVKRPKTLAFSVIGSCFVFLVFSLRVRGHPLKASQGVTDYDP